MRLSSFLLISFALHVTALSYPVAFLSPLGEQLVPIVVLNLGDGNGERAAGDNRAEGKKGKPAGPRGPARVIKADRITSEGETPTEAKDPTGNHVRSTDLEDGIAVPSSMVLSTETVASFSFQHGTSSDGDAGSAATGNAGLGSGSSIGTRKGVGSGERGTGSRFVQVSYAYNPKPEYPDNARREGKEGTVLLRVLVDEQGRSKVVELSRSSGFEALDQAALNAIRHWRFSPARYGEKPVESWASIPIVFRLADPKN